MEKENKQCDSLVTIKLEKGQVPLVVGAMRLGCFLESWCAEYIYTGVGVTDSHSGRWVNTVLNLIDNINKQSGNEKECLEKADDEVISRLEEILYKQFDENEKELNSIWDEQIKELENKEKVVLDRLRRKHPNLHLSKEDHRRIRCWVSEE